MTEPQSPQVDDFADYQRFMTLAVARMLGIPPLVFYGVPPIEAAFRAIQPLRKPPAMTSVVPIKQPTEAGYYWAAKKGCPQQIVQIAYDRFQGCLCIRTSNLAGSVRYDPLSTFDGYYGPLAEPRLCFIQPGFYFATRRVDGKPSILAADRCIVRLHVDHGSPMVQVDGHGLLQDPSEFYDFVGPIVESKSDVGR